MAASKVVEIYIQENLQENLHSETATQRADLEKDAFKIWTKFLENAYEGANSSVKLKARSCTKFEPSHSHLPRFCYGPE